MTAPVHDHTIPTVRNADEGWEWHSGVPDGVEDGFFYERIAEFGPVCAGEVRGALIEVWAIDGGARLSYDGDPSLSLAQAIHFRALLAPAIEALGGYQSPAWTLDRDQLHQRKVDLDAEAMRRCYAACPACPDVEIEL